jgi:hypothetical protein
MGDFPICLVAVGPSVGRAAEALMKAYLKSGRSRPCPKARLISCLGQRVSAGLLLRRIALRPLGRLAAYRAEQV